MLLSLSKRYIFLSNPKAASTSIETVFCHECEIASCMGNGFGLHPRTRAGGKHSNYRHIQQIFGRFFERFLPIGCYFVFGVVREPLDRLSSYYRFYGGPEMARIPVHTGHQSFDDFVAGILANAQAGKPLSISLQHDFFRDEKDEIGANFLIRFDRLAESIGTIRDVVGLDFGRVIEVALNSSRPRDTMLSDPGLQRDVETLLAKDYELYEGRTGRLLAPWDQKGSLNVDNALNWLALRGSRFDVAASIMYKLVRRAEVDPSFNVADILALVEGERPAQAKATAGHG